MIDIFAIMPVKLPLSMLYMLHVLVSQCRVTMWLQCGYNVVTMRLSQQWSHHS